MKDGPVIHAGGNSWRKSTVYFFEEHRKQTLNPAAGRECRISVLRDDEPSVGPVSFFEAGFGPIMRCAAGLVGLLRPSNRVDWRVVMYVRSASFPATRGPIEWMSMATVPDVEQPCGSREEANAVALRLAASFMRERGLKVDPAEAPLRLGLGFLLWTFAATFGAIAFTFALIGILSLASSSQPVGGTGTDSAWLGLVAAGIPVTGAILGVAAVAVAGRAWLRHRRRLAITAHARFLQDLAAA